MAAQYLYNVYTQTILFSTILGRVCDVVTFYNYGQWGKREFYEQ